MTLYVTLWNAIRVVREDKAAKFPYKAMLNSSPLVSPNDSVLRWTGDTERLLL